METDAHQYNRTVNEMCTELRQFADQHKQVVRIQQQTQEQQLERVNPNTASVPARSTTRRDVTAATAGRCSGGRSHHRSDSSVSRRGVVFVLDMTGFLQNRRSKHRCESAALWHGVEGVGAQP